MSKDLFIRHKYYRYSPIRFFGERIIKKITEETIDTFIKFIGEDEKVLDIGAGAGWIAKSLQERKKARMTLLDVINLNQTNLPLILYDGRKMPFPENSFDTALLIHVLHHCDRPQEVLKETKRVVRDKIIIIEEAPSFWFDKIFLYFRDTVNNLFFCFLVSELKEITNLPFHFKKISEWQEILENLDLKIIHKKQFPSFLGVSSALLVVGKYHTQNEHSLLSKNWPGIRP